MATSVDVLVPVLNRPQRVRPLVESLANTARFVDVNAVFLVSPGDDAQMAACVEVSKDWPVAIIEVSWPAGHGDYARKMNHGAARSTCEFVFLGADDLTFHPGWIEYALAAQQETGACVVGTNDLANAKVRRGEHATHLLVHRDYLQCGTIDEPGKLLHEGYGHQNVDNELVETARHRGTWAFAERSHVEHAHPFWRTAPMDATYRKGQATSAEDQRLFLKRRHLWT